MAFLADTFNKLKTKFSNTSPTNIEQQSKIDEAMNKGKTVTIKAPKSERYTYLPGTAGKWLEKFRPETQEEKDTLSPIGFFRQGEIDNERQKKIAEQIKKAAADLGRKKLTKGQEALVTKQAQQEQMYTQDIPSTAIKKVKYDPKTKELWVTFQGSNKKYWYPRVPKEKIEGAKGKPVETQACLAGFKDLKVFDAAGTVIFTLDNSTLPGILDGSATFECDNAAKITYTKREVFYHDMVKGDLSKPLDSMRDFIIIRSDGSPVFHLANVWDDIDQRVTHIVRGDDHVENTYRHLFLFHLLGYQVPVYAHLPMIVNKQGKPYSKRDGDAFVGDFRDKGILPEALFNYLTLLGWAPGDDREKMSKAELVEAFQIERAQHSPAQFDQAKLANMNGLYIAEMEDARFIELAWDFAQRMDWFNKADKAKFDEVAKLLKSRTKVFTDLATWGYFFNDGLEYDAKGVRKFLSAPEQRAGLEKLAAGFESGTFSAPEDVENFIRATESACGMGEFQLNQPLRVAATGTTVGAGMYETVLILGTAETAKRIRTALEKNLPA